MAETLEVNLVVKAIDNVTSEVKRIGTEVEKLDKKAGFGNMLGGITALSTGFLAVTSAVGTVVSGMRGFVNSIEVAIDAAREQQDAENDLFIAMARRGDLTEKNIKANLALADSLQNLTTYADEEILRVQKAFVLYGVQQDQLSDLTKATLDYAAAKNIDLSTATEQINRVIQGTNTLGRYKTGLDEVAGTAARTTGVIKLLNDQFGGTAQAQLNTFGGAIKRVQNLWDNLLEAFGNFIVKNPAIIRAINTIGDALIEITTWIQSNNKVVVGFIISLVNSIINGTKTIVSALSVIVPVMKVVTSAITGAVGILDKVFSKINIVYMTIKGLPGLISDAKKLMGKEEGPSIFDTVLQELDKLSTKIGEINVTDYIKNSEKETKKLAKAFKDTAVSATDFQKIALQLLPTLNTSFDGMFKTLNEVPRKLRESQVELAKLQAAIAEGKEVDNNLLIKVRADIKQFEKELEAAKNRQKYMNVEIAAGFVAEIGKGAAGVGPIVTKALSAGIDTFAPGLGTALGPLFDTLQKSPAELKSSIKAFMDGLAQAVINIIDNIPVLIEALIEALPTLIERLIVGLINALPKIINFLLTQLPRIVTNFITSIVQKIPDIIKAFVAAIPQIINGFIKAFTDPNFISQMAVGFTTGFIQAAPQIAEALVKGIINAINPFQSGGGIAGGILGGIGSVVGGIVGGIGSIFGFAEGADVPNLAKYEGDRFGPVMLDAGETVLDSATARRLNQFLSGQGQQSNAPINVTLQVGEKELANVLLDINRRGFRTA